MLMCVVWGVIDHESQNLFAKAQWAGAVDHLITLVRLKDSGKGLNNLEPIAC